MRLSWQVSGIRFLDSGMLWSICIPTLGMTNTKLIRHQIMETTESKPKQKKIKQHKQFRLGKRQKFIISVVILSVGLFILEYLFTQFGVYLAFLISGLANVFLYWTLRKDLKENFYFQIFILPFLYCLSFGLFYFLEPALLRTRIITTTLFSIGLYSLFLSENIFIVASIRTIALLNGARIVTFVVTLISYFFLTNIIFSLRTNIFLTLILILLSSMLFLVHALWTYTFEKDVRKDALWILVLSCSLVELATILWFWPTTSTITALFLTGAFYTLVGLVQVWLDKKLFKGVLWEYVWVACFIFFLLLWFTHW